MIKNVAGRVLIPLTRWYLRKPRLFSYRGLRFVVYPGVFHPGLFSSTLFILRFLEKQDIRGRSLLELGCGSGAIAVRCAKRQAVVTASDLSRRAVENARKNAELNAVTVKTHYSDLFDNIPAQQFDWIIINPPYYSRDAITEEELAWNCGGNLEYFEKLYSQLHGYVHQNSFVLMVLTRNCDLQGIRAKAAKSGFHFETVAEKTVLFDGKDFLFRIRSHLP